MEVNAFRSFKMVLGMSGGGSSTSTGNDTQDTASISNKPRTDSSSSSASHRSSSSHSSRSSRSGHSRSRRHRSSAEELNLPLDRDFVAVPHEEEDHAAGGGEAVDADRVRDQVREEVVCMIFDLPRSTTFYQDFSCALAAAFPMHGRMYPTGTHVCFYSNVFGSERKILIPYESIAEMVKTTTLMFQGAIRIKTTTGEDYTFTSFWGSNRETCFDLIAKVRDRVLGNSVDSRDQSESSSSRSESHEDQVDQDNDADNHRMLQRTVSDGGIVTAPRDISMTLLVEEVFNVSVDTFLTTFVLDGAAFGFEEYNKRIGTTEMQCNPWSTPEDDSTLGRTRELQFRVPIDSPIGPKSSRVDILQCYKVAANDVRIIESSTRLVDIPYGDYFSVEDRWTLVPHPRAPNTCTLTIELKVVFSKSTFWRSQIESRALSDNKAKWIAWVGMAKEHLAQGNGTLTRANAPAIESPPPPPVKHTETPRRPTGVVDVDPRGDSAATRSQSYSSGRTRRRRRRVIAVVIPWLIILVLIAILFKLHATIQRMEHLMAATEQRIIQIQSELAQVQPRLEANAVCSGELGR